MSLLSPGASPQAACSAGAHSGARRPPHQLRDPDHFKDEKEDDNDEDKLSSLRSCSISI